MPTLTGTPRENLTVKREMDLGTGVSIFSMIIGLVTSSLYPVPVRSREIGLLLCS